MNNCKNYAAAIAALALFPAAGMFAQSDSDMAESDLMETPESSGASSLSVKATYSLATEDFVADESVDLMGVTLEYTKRFGSSTSVVQPEFLVSLGFGYGTEDFDVYVYHWYGSHSDHLDLDVYSVNLALGVNLRFNLGDSVSLWLGPRVGSNFMYLDYELSGCSEGGSDNDSDFGFLYGGEFGLDINFTPHQTLTFGVGYLASTATPEDIEEQSYVQFSVGYKYTF